jgi:ribose 5-phosphate isomerase B
MLIGIGSDHAGYAYKTWIIDYLKKAGHQVQDFGTDSERPVDYPTFIRPVALAIARHDVDRGIVLGGSGNGEAMVANRVPGVRCALCWDVVTAELGRRHNDANCISVGARMISYDTFKAIVNTWLTTPFDGGRHTHRIEMIDHPPDEMLA